MSKFPDFLNQVGEKALIPIATNIGTTLADLWFIAFAAISNKANIKRIEYANGIEKLKQSTEERTSRIPSDDLKTPNIQIALQALEQAKFCVEEDILREMFAELIASSMMKSRESIVHPSYASLLSQLSPDDALALLQFKDQSLLPILSIIATHPIHPGYYKVLNDVWGNCNNYQTYIQSQAQASSLVRLGLIEVCYTEHITDDAPYEALYNDSLRELANQILQTSGHSEYQLNMQKGCIRLTRFGMNFISCVLPN